MATYKEIRGTQIEAVASDPSNPVEGQVWYNTTTDKIKARQQFVGNAWSTGGNINKIQLSPTVQATKSNYLRKHGGKKWI